jgi:hypothetical protein
MPSEKPCAVCTQLWREYALATKAHVDLLKMQATAAGSNLEEFKRLEPEVSGAAAVRSKAQEAVQAHLVAEHADQ